MPKKKPKLPEHLRGKTPEEITEYIMGGMVRGQPEGETIGDYFAKARSKAAEQARKNEAAGMIEWEEGEWISPAEFRSRQLAAGYAHMDEVAKRGYRERDVAAQEMSVEDEDEHLNISSMLRGRNKAAKELMEAVRLAAPMPLMNYFSEQEMRGRRAGQVRRGFTDKEGRTQLIINPLPKKQEQLWTPW